VVREHHAVFTTIVDRRRIAIDEARKPHSQSARTLLAINRNLHNFAQPHPPYQLGPFRKNFLARQSGPQNLHNFAQ